MVAWAFVIVVTFYLCKPQPKEYAIFESEMSLGTPNALSPHTQPSETPEFFFSRCKETYKRFRFNEETTFSRQQEDCMSYRLLSKASLPLYPCRKSANSQPRNAVRSP